MPCLRKSPHLIAEFHWSINFCKQVTKQITTQLGFSIDLLGNYPCKYDNQNINIYSREASGRMPQAERVYNLVARITWTARVLSRMQNSMRHKSRYEYILGVRQWLHVGLNHGAFCVSRQHSLCSWWLAHFHLLFMKGSCVVYSSMKQCLQSVNHEQFPINITQNGKHNKWPEIFNFQPKLLWRMPTKIHRKRGRRQQHEAAHKAQRTSLSTAKATSSTQRPQTCTEAAAKHYNYTANGADEEREHRLPTLQKAMGRSGNAYSLQQNYLFKNAIFLEH